MIKLSEVSQTRQISYDITAMQNLKIIEINLLTKQKQTHRHRKQTYGCQRGEGRRHKLGVWNEQIHTTKMIFKLSSGRRE